MLIEIREAVLQHIRNNLAFYLLVALIFSGGIMAGALVVRVLPETQVGELSKYLFHYFVDFTREELPQQFMLRESITGNLKYILAIWLSGALVVGFPLIFIFLFIRGFILGFTVGFLVDQIAFQGIVFAITSILPHNILVIPALMMAGVSAMSYSLAIIKVRLKIQKYSGNTLFWNYSLLIILSIFFIALAGFIEAYITPVFMRIIIPFLKIN
ncbi:MAG: stage II sporulation protein M [Candidatus Syntrophonatronum acetioxidans]|uniref:Stage II sporulation protein M n=1 Tax=Candidatus Syntrophonatronum acetioxidans TaxID=1795816 RepID=A0A424YDZ8_9FIRM|nr:MAG: stage II sporulation protein M [Candidatus Syntrophonatronum acetioxidans]